MNKESIIKLIANHKPYERYCNKLANYDLIAEDLLQEFRLFMCEKTSEELIKLYNSGYLENYCISVIYRKSKDINKRCKIKGKENALLSISSFTLNIDSVNKIDSNDYNYSIDDNYEKVMNFVNSDSEIGIEDFIILSESLNSKGLIELSKQTGIPYITIKTNLKRIKDKIRDNVSI